MQNDVLMLVMEELGLDKDKSSVKQTIFLSESGKPKGGVLSNVHILGFDSKNGYTYESDAVKNAVTLYEGSEVYLNHSKVVEGKTEERNVEDKFGYFKNVKFAAEGGLYGDFIYNEKHPYAEAFEWWIEHAPSRIGFSHEALVRKTADSRVTEIAAVRLVALVSTPATTTGVFEGVIQDKMDADAKANRLRDLTYTAQSMISDCFWMQDADDDSDRAAAMLPILRDLLKEVRTLASMPEEATEGNVMDLTKLTLDDIKKHKPELLSEAIKQHETAEKALAEKVAEAVKDIPDKLRTDIFLALVREHINDAAKVKALIDDRKALVPVVEQKPETKVETTQAVAPVQEQVKSKVETPKPLTDDVVLAAWGK